MRKTHLTLTAVGLLAVLGLGLFAGAQTGANRAEPTSVAVLNMQDLFNELTEFEELKADISTREDELKAKIEEWQTKVDDMQVKASYGDEAEREKIGKDLKKALLEYQVWRKMSEDELAGQRIIAIEALYRKVAETGGQVARERGFDVLLYSEQPFSVNANADIQQVFANMASRKVIWADDNLDITNHVISRMNSTYKAGR